MLTADQKDKPKTIVLIVDDSFYGKKDGKKVIFKRGDTVTLPHFEGMAAVSANQAHEAPKKAEKEESSK